MSRKKRRVFRRQRKLSRSRASHTRNKPRKIKRIVTRSSKTGRFIKRKIIYVTRKKKYIRRVAVKKRIHHVVKKKKRVVTQKPTRKVTILAPKKDRQKVASKKKRRQIIRVTERRKFSTRLDFSKSATFQEKLKYLVKKVHDGMILRFVIKAPKGKGSPTKRAKKTGKVIRRSPYISTGWINFGSLSPERIEYYLTQLGGIDRIERIFYMPKR